MCCLNTPNRTTAPTSLSFNPFLFRGVLSVGLTVKPKKVFKFQSLLIQGCVVWNRPIPWTNANSKVSIPSYSGVCCLHHNHKLIEQKNAKVSIPSYSGVCCLLQGEATVAEAIEFQSLLIQGCVVWKNKNGNSYRMKNVSIPSYSGVCCLIPNYILTPNIFTVSIPSYSGVCCLRCIKFRLSNNFVVSIPSYSGVCCLYVRNG